MLKIRGCRDLLYAIYDPLLTKVMPGRGFCPDGTPIPGPEFKSAFRPIYSIFQPVDTRDVLREANIDTEDEQ